MAKREVTMCDKKGCDVQAAGVCALCDADVCKREHATQPRLKAEVKDGGFVAVPLPVLVCKECAEATLVERGDEATRAKYVVDEWPPDMPERLKPLFEVIRAALAKRALEDKPPERPAPVMGGSIGSVTVPPTNPQSFPGSIKNFRPGAPTGGELSPHQHTILPEQAHKGGSGYAASMHPCDVCDCADYSTDYSLATHDITAPAAPCKCGHDVVEHQI